MRRDDILIGITDDPAAGFDGYQSGRAESPSTSRCRRSGRRSSTNTGLQYINPPPAYSEQTQRLRTPSEILASKSGTCIDLALLLASCLEYIGVYPVVVLLTGHAFVGYWRSEEAHDEVFVSVQTIPPKVPAVGDKIRGARADCRYVDPIRMAPDQAELRRDHGIRDIGRSHHAGSYLPDRRATVSTMPRRKAGLICAAARSSTACSTSSSHGRLPPVTPLPIINDVTEPTMPQEISEDLARFLSHTRCRRTHHEEPVRRASCRLRRGRGLRRRIAAAATAGRQQARQPDQDCFARRRGRGPVLARRNSGARSRPARRSRRGPRRRPCRPRDGALSCWQRSFRCWRPTRSSPPSARSISDSTRRSTFRCVRG